MPDILARLTDGPAKLKRSSALNRLRGFLVGASGTGAIVLEFSHENADNHVDAFKQVLATVKRTTGLKRADLKLGGSVYEAVFIAESSERSLNRYAPVSFAVALVIAWFAIGELRLTLIVLFISVYSQIFGLALLYYSGGHLNAVLIVLPSLLFMLTLSAAVHIVNYFKDHGGRSNPLAPQEAIRLGSVPCLLATATTTIGLLSLLLSRLQPIREFGLFSAVGLIVSTIVLLVTFPYLATVGTRSKSLSDSTSSVSRGSFRGSWRVRLGRFINRYPNLVFGLCCASILLAGLGLPRVRSTFRLDNMFDKRTEILRNYTWLEEHIGSFASVEVVCEIDEFAELSELQKVGLVKQIHLATMQLSEVSGVYSAMTFLPPSPRGGGIACDSTSRDVRATLDAKQESTFKAGCFRR